MRDFHLFKKKNKNEIVDIKTDAKKKNCLKYPKPNILLIDIKDQSKEKLLAEGYNISTGSFGSPYKIPQSDKFLPVITNHTLCDYSEQEIVIIDLVPNNPLSKPIGEKCVSDGENDWWAKCSQGIIDPRIRTMCWVQDDFDRILQHGGLFVIFADCRRQQDLKFGCIDRGSFIYSRDIDFDNWSFLSTLTDKHIIITPDQGTEFTVSDSKFSNILSKYLSAAFFLCCFERQYYIKEENWLVLATNKYGACVSGAIYVDNGQKRNYGFILIFPQIIDKSTFLLDLMRETLPLIAPHLFPHIEEAKWIYQKEYELPEVINLKEQIIEIKQQASSEIENIKGEIEKVHEGKKYLYDLLRETDRSLVKAVIKSLEVLGFSDIVDVDEQLKEAESNGSLREDIQIKDRSPILILDVKGLTSSPSDSEAMQSHKHATIRMKEWGRTDVNSVTIINHQRHLPPLERDNSMPFRQEILDSASQVDLGLMTTWDLFRLVKSFTKNNWKSEHVKSLLYHSGRINIIPINYEYIGYVNHIWNKANAISIQIEAIGLKKGDKIGFELPVEFEEQIAESLQLNDNDVAEANVGDEVGIRTHLTKRPMREGTRVYIVRENGPK